MNTNAIGLACEIAGGQAALARLLGVHPSLPHQWVKGHRPVPAERCPAIERVTAGVVSCEALRPDVDWAYIRSKPVAGGIGTGGAVKSVQEAA